MKNFPELSFFLGLLFFITCFQACERNKRYELDVLKKNYLNQKKLRVSDMSDFKAFDLLFEKLSELSNEELIKLIESDNPELYEVSYAFYYIGNNYARAQDNQKALDFHRINAANYLNPQSFLKLSEYYFYVDKDYEKSYINLATALELKIEFTSNNRSHPIAKNGREKSQYLLSELKKIAAEQKFNMVTINEKLKNKLPELMEQCRVMYKLAN